MTIRSTPSINSAPAASASNTAHPTECGRPISPLVKREVEDVFAPTVTGDALVSSDRCLEPSMDAVTHFHDSEFKDPSLSWRCPFCEELRVFEGWRRPIGDLRTCQICGYLIAASPDDLALKSVIDCHLI
jgi:hypothetical protein